MSYSYIDPLSGVPHIGSGKKGFRNPTSVPKSKPHKLPRESRLDRMTIEQRRAQVRKQGLIGVINLSRSATQKAPTPQEQRRRVARRYVTQERYY